MQIKDTSWIEISKQNLQHNIKTLQGIVGKQVSLMPVLKSNAYGHGMVQVAKFLTAKGIEYFGTVNLEEALILRNNNIRKKILVLSFYNPSLLKDAIRKRIMLTVYGYGAAKKLDDIAKKLNSKAKIHIKIDTGTSRLGIRPENAIEEVKKISKLNNIVIDGIFSHLSDAENPNQKITKHQNDVFKKNIQQLKSEVKINKVHLACSAALILNNNTHYDLVRPGISVYGLNSIQNGKGKKLNLKPILSWHTKIIQIKKIPKGTYVGYNQSFRANKKMTIALIPIGYWDGYDRKLSNNSQVLISGKKCNVIGNICMNLTIVDVTHINNIKTGDLVTLIGKQKNNAISADYLAKRIKTINYEVVTRINPLIKRYLI